MSFKKFFSEWVSRIDLLVPWILCEMYGKFNASIKLAIVLPASHTSSFVQVLTSNLETVNLGHNSITNRGVFTLKRGLLQNRSLLRLGLQAAKISCEGQRCLPWWLMVCLYEDLQCKVYLSCDHFASDVFAVDRTVLTSDVFYDNKTILISDVFQIN